MWPHPRGSSRISSCPLLVSVPPEHRLPSPAPSREGLPCREVATASEGTLCCRGHCGHSLRGRSLLPWAPWPQAAMGTLCDVTAARAPSRKREQGRQMCRCCCHRRPGRVLGGIGDAGSSGDPGQVGRGPRAVVGWGAPLATSGHPSCAQASVSPSAQWMRGWRCGQDSGPRRESWGRFCSGCALSLQNRALACLGLSFPVSQGRGMRGLGSPAPLAGFAELVQPI